MIIAFLPRGSLKFNKGMLEEVGAFKVHRGGMDGG